MISPLAPPPWPSAPSPFSSSRSTTSSFSPPCSTLWRRQRNNNTFPFLLVLRRRPRPRSHPPKRTSAMNEQPIFDHEKLDVYQVELSFVAWSSILLSEIRTA